jgi:hypothetical protein
MVYYSFAGVRHTTFICDDRTADRIADWAVFLGLEAYLMIVGGDLALRVANPQDLNGRE